MCAASVPELGLELELAGRVGEDGIQEEDHSEKAGDGEENDQSHAQPVEEVKENEQHGGAEDRHHDRKVQLHFAGLAILAAELLRLKGQEGERPHRSQKKREDDHHQKQGQAWIQQKLPDRVAWGGGGSSKRGGSGGERRVPGIAHPFFPWVAVLFVNNPPQLFQVFFGVFFWCCPFFLGWRFARSNLA